MMPLQVENQMVSAERVLAYCKVDQEASLESKPEDKPADDWPAKGNIEVSIGCSDRVTPELLDARLGHGRFTVMIHIHG